MPVWKRFAIYGCRGKHLSIRQRAKICPLARCRLRQNMGWMDTLFCPFLPPISTTAMATRGLFLSKVAQVDWLPQHIKFWFKLSVPERALKPKTQTKLSSLDHVAVCLQPMLYDVGNSVLLTERKGWVSGCGGGGTTLQLLCALAQSKQTGLLMANKWRAKCIWGEGDVCHTSWCLNFDTDFCYPTFLDFYSVV